MREIETNAPEPSKCYPLHSTVHTYIYLEGAKIDRCRIDFYINNSFLVRINFTESI